MSVQNFVLSFGSELFRHADLLQVDRLTQLELGSRNLHHTPSSTTSFIRRQRLRKTPSIRFRKSMMPASSLARVGLAA